MRALLDPQDGNYRLVASTLGGKPASFFVELIVKHCKDANPRRQPPFISGGNFLSVVRVAYEEMERGAARAGLKGDEVPSSIFQAFIHVVERKKINHIPWSANPTARAGNPYTTITPTVWLNLGAKPAPKSSQAPSFLSREWSSHSLALRSSEDIQTQDSRGEWSAIEVKLVSFQSVRHKTVLPSECDIVNASLGGNEDYVVAAYQYVQTSYDPSKPIHLLALISSVICAGLLPRLFHTQFVRGSYPTDSSRYASFIRNLDWTSKSRKGSSQPAPFIVMVTTFIISLYDPDSPLASRLEQNTGDLTNWFNKHSAKGINTFLMCRLGLATPHTARTFHAPKWKNDIMPLSNPEIREKYTEVSRLLKTGRQYGGFDVVNYMMGPKAAEILSQNHFVTARPLPPPSTFSAASSTKRNVRDWEGDEVSFITAGSDHRGIRKVSRRG
ncbi:hypothetical protein HYDPIDRAFT_120514 [Hydnomerulius pinastri MD-312]|uniref:Uncharacterized protein n=1 Tax=Hydnomerulius pinastri MD-312 TaxID=994086 RepID=A0A0C9W687_9AGAM|nr:hypothetical protein HYDPIDRAFT_120514 [Hydnomerulius pinastri MD-312]